MFPFLKNKKLKEETKDLQLEDLEKGDFLAMFLAAVLTFLPPILLILSVFYGLLYWFFLR